MWDTMELSEDDKMEVANINTVLGERAGVLKFVLKKVFGQLSPKDMKSVMLVCWEWKDMGEEPQFWAWVSLRVIRENLATMPEVLGLRRLQGVRQLEVRAMSQELLRVVAWHKGLRAVDMAETDLVAVEPELLARVVNKLEEVDMRDAGMTSEQVEEIIDIMSAGDTKLKKIDLSGRKESLSSIEPDQMERALSKLEHVAMNDSQLSGEQTGAILASINTTGTRMKSLKMGNNKGLGKVEPQVLALAAANLEELDLGNSYSRLMVFMSLMEGGMVGLNSLQIEAICSVIITENTRLKKFVLGYSKLFSVEANLLAGALNRLEEVDLCHNSLTSQQARALFTAISGGTELRKLNLEGCSFSMTLDVELLAMALNKLEEVNLPKLNGHQINAIMTSLASGGSKLKSLNIKGTDLSLVDPGLLVEAVNKLEEVAMGSTKTTMTKEQTVALLNSLLKGDSKLKKLDVIMSDNLLSMEPVLLARAVTKLENVRLFHTKMTEQQVGQIFTFIDAKDSKLKMLSLPCETPLTSLEPSVLARAANRLESLHMSGSKLSLEQVEAILSQSLVKTSLKTLDLGLVQGGLQEEMVARAKLVIRNVYVKIIKEKS